MFQAPFYNRSSKFDIRDFQEHNLQNLLALFIHKKTDDLLSRIKFCPKFCREDIFFDEFTRFIGKYLNYETVPVDAMIYFKSSAEQKAGTQLGVGGTGNKSSSYAKSMRDANQRSVQYNSAMTRYFEEKFRASIHGDKDERVFLDVPRIWDQIAEEKYAMPEKWLAVVARSYDDATLSAPVPAEMDKALVPLDIRNKVVQTHAKLQTANRIVATTTEEESEYNVETNLAAPAPVPPAPAKKIEIDAELQKMMEDEDW